MDYQLFPARQLSENNFVVKSIVTTDMTSIAGHYGVELRSVYTGFKFIAEQIKISEQTGKGNFVFGYEESYGYLFGKFVRDKDAIQAAMKTVEAACYYAENGLTLYEALIKLYEKYGWYSEIVISNTLYGQEGIAKIMGAVEKLRGDIPLKIGDFTVRAVRDYKSQIKTVYPDNATVNIPMDSMNVLYFELDGGRFIVRPSGTEPKLKSYLSTWADDEKTSLEQLEKLKTAASALLDELLN
jgi:phosphoglucomutase